VPQLVSMDELLAIAGAMPRGIIAVDGLPASGKSTLADRLEAAFGYERVCLDDFILPHWEWPTPYQATFPFKFARYAEFMAAVKSLAETGECTFVPFDWAALRLSPVPRTVRLDRPLVIEGVSALHADLCQYYALKIFVDSDRGTTDEASKVRGLGIWAEPWDKMFLPSSDLYMKTNPMTRADVILRGRGAGRGQVRTAQG
jgi:uridine kinase